jgi:hypothetical protein
MTREERARGRYRASAWQLSVSRALWAWHQHGIQTPIDGDAPERHAIRSTRAGGARQAGGQP